MRQRTAVRCADAAHRQHATAMPATVVLTLPPVILCARCAARCGWLSIHLGDFKSAWWAETHRFRAIQHCASAGASAGDFPTTADEQKQARRAAMGDAAQAHAAFGCAMYKLYDVRDHIKDHAPHADRAGHGNKIKWGVRLRQD